MTIKALGACEILHDSDISEGSRRMYGRETYDQSTLWFAKIGDIDRAWIGNALVMALIISRRVCKIIIDHVKESI